MSFLKEKDMAKKLTNEELVSLWMVAIVLASVGAQGKSTAAETFTHALRLMGHDVKVFSADVQRKLKRKLGGCVEELSIDLLEETEDDPLALLRAFSKFAAATGEGPRDRASVVLDTAATWDKTTIRYLHDLEFDRRVTEAGGIPIIALVTTSNTDAIKSMLELTPAIQKAMPLACVVWVLNERHGPVFANPDYEVLGFDAAAIQQMRSTVTEVTFPKMDERLWTPVDRAGMSMMKFIDTDAAVLSKFWPSRQGKVLDPSSAAIVKRDISNWIGQLLEAASVALRFRRP
jgi:hypothetical protein